ncbi:NAD(P)/FAD-dependent oxidoreductase [Pelagibacterium lacus]|uniref:FAD-binding oxidoreductase n=1 Tax=Pelagibacterium lacus TaxID=2282655 RepID=A0A369W4F1_9HYPH|nr:FAD-binding oxidoreductase [Pelagibacterium lacus]RDE08887.1 FAD-binding oxidoreductase [Pelagibacterium lacus]
MLSDKNHNNLWSATARPAPATHPLQGDATADVVIIGAGYTGLSSALHLAEAGKRAVVLEAKSIGHGGSGRNVGLVNAGMWVMPNDLIKTQGEKWGMTLITALGQGPARVFELAERFGMDCEAIHNGTLHLGVGASGYEELGERARQWQALGAPVERLDKDQTAKLTGTNAPSGALLDKRAGTIQPLGYVRGLAEAALSLGAEIYTVSPVTAAVHEDGLWRISTPGGTVTAPWVIVATNAYTGLVPDFPFASQREELTILPYFQFATQPLPEAMANRILPQRQGCWDTRTVMTSLRMDKAGRLVFGSVGALEPISVGTQRAFARRTLASLFPFLPEITLDHFWHGQIGMTDNALPKFHRYGPNAIGVNGFNGRGIATGTVFGQAMARHIAEGEAMILPETKIGAAPLGRTKTRFYKLGSQMLHFISSRI